MKKPLVSVVIPTLNEEKNILRCLKSIKKQSYKGNIEIILVDNYSTDKTVEIAAKYTDKIFVEGHERSEQRNIGAKHAKGWWILFVDADMELSTHVVEECIALTKKRLLSPIIAVNEIAKGYSFWGKALALEKSCYKGITWVAAARFFPKKYFQKLKGYDETLPAGEDWDITQRFLEQGFSMLFTKSIIIHHETKKSLLKLLKKEIYYIKHLDRYARKHPHAFSYQGSFLYRGLIWIRSWHELIKHPLLSSGFLAYKLLVWLIWKWYIRKKSYVNT